jgi:UDP:flavonoid glycosyltransferase YjiC (YdhE family)
MAALSIADVFITHCGMNSASEGLYFETPLLLFPQTNEQNAVAERTMQLGAGIGLDDISPQNILARTEELLNNSTYKECAVKISESFKRSGGVQEARKFIESVAENRNS